MILSRGICHPSSVVSWLVFLKPLPVPVKRHVSWNVEFKMGHWLRSVCSVSLDKAAPFLSGADMELIACMTGLISSLILLTTCGLAVR